MKYQINLVRLMRLEEQRTHKLHNRTFTLATTCIGLLILSTIFLVFQTLGMRLKIDNERDTLAKIETEYSKYQSTRMLVDKADLERLDSLQAARIFWTKKLAAMAFYLPENYWITKFSFDNVAYKVSGYGYISPEQRQLITLDNYLNKLRADTTYSDAFKATYMNSVQRSDESGRSRVGFEYSSNR